MPAGNDDYPHLSLNNGDEAIEFVKAVESREESRWADAMQDIFF